MALKRSVEKTGQYPTYKEPELTEKERASLQFQEIPDQYKDNTAKPGETGIEVIRRKLQDNRAYHAQQLERINQALHLIEEDTRVNDLNDLLRKIDEP